MDDVHGETCSVAATAELIAAKWTAVIVHDLSEGPRRFTQLEHACPGISPRTLAERLQMLEQEGIVSRRSYHESPPRVDYELTDKGHALLPIIGAMRDFRPHVADHAVAVAPSHAARERLALSSSARHHFTK